jgi:hypothetical protein
VKGDWDDVGPTEVPLVVQVTLDCSEEALAHLQRTLAEQVTGRLELRRERGVGEPRVRILGLNRFFAAPTCDRIRRDVMVLLEQWREAT